MTTRVGKSLRNHFDSVADMKAANLKVGDHAKTLGYDEVGDGGGGEYVIVAMGSGVHDGGSYHDLNNGLQAKLLISGNIIVNQWGVKTGNLDNTSRYSAINEYIQGGETLEWLNLGSFYRGSAIFTKQVNLVGNNSVLQDWDTNAQILGVNAHLPSGDFNSHAVIESVLEHGDTQFTITGASNLFQIGDIGYLWDGAVRPTGGDVNFECIKIKSILNDTITVEGIIRSNKSVSGISFYHTTNQIKNVNIRGFKIKASATHTNVGCYVVGCEIVNIEDITTEDTLGNAASARYCYDVNFRKMRHNKPAGTLSGQGYGTSLLGCTKFTVENVKGEGMRHMIDINSSYYGTIKEIEDTANQNSIIEASHNGFASYLIIENIRGKVLQYPINFSGAGYGTKGAGNAEKIDHPLRFVTVRDVDVTIDSSKTVNDFNVSGVYINQNTFNVTIENIKSLYLNTVPLVVDDISSTMVRINGINLGGTTIDGVYTNKIGLLVFSDGSGSGASASADVATIRNMNVSGACNIPIFLQGTWRCSIDDISCGSIIGATDVAFIRCQSSASGVTQEMFIGESLYYGGANIPMYINTTGTIVDGNFQGIRRSMTGNVNVVNGGTISITDIQNRRGSLSLEPPNATAITMDDAALPIPLINGQVLSIYNTLNTSDGDRGTITFPGVDGGINPTSTLSKSFTIADDGSVQHLISRAGKWYLH